MDTFSSREVVASGRLQEKHFVKHGTFFKKKTRAHYDDSAAVAFCIHLGGDLPALMLEFYDREEDIDGHEPKRVHDLNSVVYVLQSNLEPTEMILGRRDIEPLTLKAPSETECKKWVEVCADRLQHFGVLSNSSNVFDPANTDNYLYSDNLRALRGAVSPSAEGIFSQMPPPPPIMPLPPLPSIEDSPSTSSASPSPPSSSEICSPFVRLESMCEDDPPLPTRSKSVSAVAKRLSAFRSNGKDTSTRKVSSEESGSARKSINGVPLSSHMPHLTAPEQAEVRNGMSILVDSAKALTLHRERSREEFDPRLLHEVTLALYYVVENFLFVRFDGKIWLAGWTQKADKSVGSNFRVGDRLVRANHIPVTNSTLVPHIFFDAAKPGEPLRLTVLEQPHAKIINLVKPINHAKSLGIEFCKSTNKVIKDSSPNFFLQIENVVEDSQAWHRGVPVMMPSFIDANTEVPAVVTEVNGQRLNLFAMNKQAARHIEQIPAGTEFSLTVQPYDFVKTIKKVMKSTSKNEYVFR